MKKWILKIILLPLLISMHAFPNVLGDMQTFVPNTDGLDFITVSFVSTALR